MGIAKNIIKNTSFAFITSVVEMGISFFVSITLTRGLGTEQYGLYSYTLWLLGLTSIATNLGLGEMVRRFIPESIGRKNPEETVGYVQTSILFRSIAAVIVFVGILASSSFWIRQTDNAGDQVIFLIVAITIIPNTIQYSLIAILKGFQRFDYALYMTLAMYPLRLILIIIFMTLGFGVFEILLLNIGTFILGIIIGIFFLGRLISYRALFSRSILPRGRQKQIWKYSLTVTGIIVLQYLVSQQVAVFIIGLYCPVDEVGFYTLAFRMAALFSLFPSAFAYVLLPIFSEQYGSGDKELLGKVYITSSRFLVMVALPLAVGGIALANPIVTLIYGAEYQATIILFQIICLPMALINLNGPADSVIRGINRPGFILVVQVFCAIINIGLSFWLVPMIGILGAVIAFSTLSIIILPANLIFIRNTVGASWPIRDTLKAIIGSILMGAIIYGIQTQLNNALSLIICIPLGIIIYFVIILTLKYIHEEDLVILRNVLESLPERLKTPFFRIIGFIEKFM